MAYHHYRAHQICICCTRYAAVSSLSSRDHICREAQVAFTPSTTPPYNILGARLKCVAGMWQTTGGPYVLNRWGIRALGGTQATGA